MEENPTEPKVTEEIISEQIPETERKTLLKEQLEEAMGAKYAQIQIKTRDDVTASESEVEIAVKNALLAKNKKINIDDLKREVLRMDKTMKRHDRDLTKLKPVTL
jgi:hypothetical protein